MCPFPSSSSGPSKDPVEHIYEMHDSNCRPTLSLKVYSWAQSSDHLPVFYDGCQISGDVEISLEKPDFIQAVVISLRGQIQGTAKYTKVFVDASETLWDAKALSARIGGTCSKSAASAQLEGHFHWPFVMSFPSTIPDGLILGCPGITVGDDLPPSFSVAGSHLEIMYELVVTVMRSGSLRPDRILSTTVTYTPRSRPAALSTLRQIAYEENTPPLGPELDEEGWKVFSSFTVRGIAFRSYNVDVLCSIALAAPLSYARGSVIPCVITLESDDSRSLDLLSRMHSPVLRLCRKVETRAGRASVTKLWDLVRPSCICINKAIWHAAEQGPSCSALEVKSGTQIRTMSGEITVPPTLTPSFSFGCLALKYEVQMLPFNAPGFVSEDGKDVALFRTDVQVTSDHAPGPRPRSYLQAPADCSKLRLARRHTVGVRRKLFPSIRSAQPRACTLT